jgi:CRISPR-associated protein Cst2
MEKENPMSKHLFGLIVTPYGAAANNRGENEGNITTLQKLLWKNEIHTTVSAEAIRWALRYFWQKRDGDDSVNRQWNDDTADHTWQDQTWAPWTSNDEAAQGQPTFIDDDVMGFMLAEAANTDGNDQLDALKADKKKVDEQLKALSKEDKKSEHGKSLEQQKKDLAAKIDVLSKGKTDKRRGALEVTRAISLSPFAGDITFNAKSGTKTNTSLYGTEVHASRYQYGIALTPQSLRVPARALDVADAIIGLCEVAGNQSRFLYDFAPESIVFRWTDDFAPRMLYGFEMDAESNLSFPAILQKVSDGDIDASELIVGGSIVATLDDAAKETLKGAFISSGVKAAAQELKKRISNDLGITGG